MVDRAALGIAITSTAISVGGMYYLKGSIDTVASKLKELETHLIATTRKVGDIRDQPSSGVKQVEASFRKLNEAFQNHQVAVNQGFKMAMDDMKSLRNDVDLLKQYILRMGTPAALVDPIKGDILEKSALTPKTPVLEVKAPLPTDDSDSPSLSAVDEDNADIERAIAEMEAIPKKSGRRRKKV